MFSQLLAQFGQGFQPPVPDPETNMWVNGLNDASESLTKLELIISAVIGMLTVIAGLFFVVSIILAGLDWIGAGGDSGKIQKARDRMIQGALGLVVIVLAYALVGVVGSVLGINILNPAATLTELLPANLK